MPFARIFILLCNVEQKENGKSENFYFSISLKFAEICDLFANSFVNIVRHLFHVVVNKFADVFENAFYKQIPTGKVRNHSSSVCSSFKFHFGSDEIPKSLSRLNASCQFPSFRNKYSINIRYGRSKIIFYFFLSFEIWS